MLAAASVGSSRQSSHLESRTGPRNRRGTDLHCQEPAPTCFCSARREQAIKSRHALRHFYPQRHASEAHAAGPATEHPSVRPSLSWLRNSTYSSRVLVPGNAPASDGLFRCTLHRHLYAQCLPYCTRHPLRLWASSWGRDAGTCHKKASRDKQTGCSRAPPPHPFMAAGAFASAPAYSDLATNDGPVASVVIATYYVQV